MEPDCDQKFCSIVDEVLDILETAHPDAHCELRYKSPFQLLVATILSAQSTDRAVNKVTEVLFRNYPELDSFLDLDAAELEEYIKEVGLYRSKARNIINMCRVLDERYNGKVPDNLDDLMSLPGVGRKTANVVLSNAFGKPAMAVDTHVFRVSNRIGLADSRNVDETERQLMNCIPRERWVKAHHLLIWHGRRICHARKPKCHVCPLKTKCRYYRKNIYMDI